MTGRIEPQSGSDSPSELSYYDVALLGVPLPLVVGVLAGALLGIPSRAGLGAEAALSALAVGYLRFFDPPTGRGPGGRRGIWRSANGLSA